MALTTSQAVRAGNGLGGRTHIMSVATGTDMEGVITEAMNEGFTIARGKMAIRWGGRVVKGSRL